MLGFLMNVRSDQTTSVVMRQSILLDTRHVTGDWYKIRVAACRLVSESFTRTAAGNWLWQSNEIKKWCLVLLPHRAACRLGSNFQALRSLVSINWIGKQYRLNLKAQHFSCHVGARHSIPAFQFQVSVPVRSAASDVQRVAKKIELHCIILILVDSDHSKIWNFKESIDKYWLEDWSRNKKGQARCCKIDLVKCLTS